MIKDEEYVNSIIIGNSADDNKEIIDKFIENGVDYFEKKPPNYRNIEKIMHEIIDKKWNYNITKLFSYFYNYIIFL